MSLCREDKSDLAHSKSLPAGEGRTGSTPQLVLIPQQVTEEPSQLQPLALEQLCKAFSSSCVQSSVAPLCTRGRWVIHTNSDTLHIRMATGVIPVGSLGHSKSPARREDSGHKSPMLLWVLLLVLVLVSRLVFWTILRERVVIGILFRRVKNHLPGKGHAHPTRHAG